jgi:hypothetical protein
MSVACMKETKFWLAYLKGTVNLEDPYVDDTLKLK